MTKKRVAITGLGALSPLGEGAEVFWRAVREGKTAVDTVHLDGNGFRVTGAAIRDFRPDKYILQPKALKVMARDIQLGVAAALMASDDAGVRALSIPRERLGVIVGAGVFDHELDELAASIVPSVDSQGKLDLKKFGTDGLSSLFPLWLLKYLPNMPACHISIFLDLQGPSNTLTTGPSAGLQALAEAFSIIQRGGADLMLAGGAESRLNPLGLSHYKVLGVLANGFVVGEGAGFVVLEEWEHARKRNAKIYGEIVGVGIAAKFQEARAMQEALSTGGVLPADVDWIQASAAGIEAEDKREARAIQEIFGESAKTRGTKAAIGFAGFSAGPLDFIFSTLSGYHDASAIRHAVTNASGLGGESVSILVRFGGKR